MKKPSYEEVKELFKINGCELISKTYAKSSDKLEYIAQCGHTNYQTYAKFKNGSGRVCNKCSKSIRYDYDFVYNFFKENNCTLLETEYINCKTPMRFIAQCGHEYILTLDAAMNSNATLKCGECKKIKKHNIEEVRDILKKENCILLSTEYITGEKIHYIAQCGHKNKTLLHKFLNGHGRKCRRCNKPKGENHPNFNPNLTSEDRNRNRDLWEIIQWRNSVYKRDNYICKKCGYDKGNKLNAHHIEGYDKHKELRFDINNGITLCKECHDNFHKKYGYGNNTKEQFNKWFNTNTEVTK